MRRVDYDQRLHRVYRAGRTLSTDTGQLWMDAIGRHLSGADPSLTILDLGAGTGRFSRLLADAFEAEVVAVEPSAGMRAEAERHGAHPRITYRDGGATAIPAPEASFDAALLSMMIHHVGDVSACARELQRVVKPGGLVFIRNVFSGRLDGVPYFEFFPTARALDEARLPTVESIRAAFAAERFAFVVLETLAQPIDPSLRAHCARIEQRAISTLELIADGEFVEGLARLRDAAEREAAPTPVVERIDFLVLRREG